MRKEFIYFIIIYYFFSEARPFSLPAAFPSQTQIHNVVNLVNCIIII